MKHIKTRLIFFLLFFCTMATAQTGAIKGSIKTSDRQPAESVTIKLKGTNRGVTSNNKGEYIINKVEPGNYTLIITSVGLEKIETPITVTTGEITLVPEISLKESSQTLKDVTVYGDKSKRYGYILPSSSLRINTPLIETPQNIEVVTKQTMEDFGINATSDMGRLVSGVQKTYGWGDMGFALSIRGFDATNSEFRDGIGFLGYGPMQQMDAFMLEKVEFVQGPSGFMIGNAEPGGVFNQVSKQADGEKVRNVELGYGSYNLLRGGLDLGDKFSKKSKFSYRVVVGGNYTNANYPSYVGSRWYVMPSLRYTYAEGSYVQLQFTKMNGLTRCPGSGNFSFNGKDFLYPNNFNPDDPNLSHGVKSRDNIPTLSHTHQFKNGWHLKTQFSYMNSTYKGDVMETIGFAPTLDSLYRIYASVNNFYYSEAAQSFIDGKFKTGKNIEHSFLTGIDYMNSWQSFPGTGFYIGGNLPLSIKNPQYNLTPSDTTGNMYYSSPERSGVTSLAWYGQDHIKILNKVILTLAGRLSSSKTFNDYTADSATRYNAVFTPRFGLTYLITKNMSVYALYDEIFEPQIGRLQDSSMAKPLTGVDREIGYKAQLMDNRLFINSSLWYTQKNNVLVQNPLTQFYEQIGQVTSKGFEVSAVGNVSKNFIVNVNYSYILATVTKDANPANVGYPNLAGTPRNNINGMLIYKFNKGKLDGLKLGTGVQVWEDIYAGVEGSPVATDVTKKAPGYAIYDANAAYDFKQLSFHLNVYNLFNKTYMPYDLSWTGASGGTPGYFSFYNRSQPLSFRLSVAYKF